MRYSELKQTLTARFQAAGIESAAVDAGLLIGELAGYSRAELFLHGGEEVPAPLAERIQELAARREAHEPLQYLLGRAWFMDLELLVTPAVLIPRPETELLVEWAVEQLPPDGAFLDLGTGSGAIALSVALARPDVAVTAVDVSPAALAVARENALRNRLDGRVAFRESDLFSAVAGGAFDLIGANLPYVAEEEYATLTPEVRLHEPVLALTAPDDGFALIERSLASLATCLKPGGKVIWELSPPQAPRLCRRLTERREFDQIEIRRDYPGRDRFVAARFTGKPAEL